MNARRPRPAWSTKRRVLTAAAALLLLVLAAWLAITLSPAPEDGPETEVVTVTRTTETRTVGLAGTIAPQQQANVSFAVPGTVQQVEVRVGDEVRQGQALARLDDRDLANAVALAQAQLSAAFAQLETIEQTDGATSA
ncbi:MAG: biotin/lipoyl-binding protein, partial [Brooklawnia sp.]|uniref:biotin/lipoyl-binding protein n=1 Tax=Brooklawnia sp. TaxID=2699740 RepID=UPI003C75AFDE